MVNVLGISSIDSKSCIEPPKRCHQTGAIASIHNLMKHADYFDLSKAQARQILSEVIDAVGTWRTVGANARVGLSAAELDDFAPAFGHGQMRRSIALLGQRAA